MGRSVRLRLAHEEMPVNGAHDDDALDIELRPVHELLERTVVLAALAQRGIIEVDAERQEYERETDRFELLTWARSALAETVTSDELRLLATPSGELGDDISRCDSALIEASSLAWALGVVPSDPLPVPQDGDAEERLLAWAPAPWSDLGRLARTLSPRPEEAVAAERERWEVWYWRSVDADDPGAIADVAADLAGTDLIPVADGDLATDAAEPFGTLTPDEQGDIAWLAEHRLRALNWACGFGADWDSVPLYPD
jgi:hypothetical protein